MRILVAHNVSRRLNGGMSRIMRRIHDLLPPGHVVDYFHSEDVPESLSPRAARLAFPALVLRHAVRAARDGRPYDVVNVHEPAGAAIATFRGLAGRPRVVVISHGVEHRGWAVAREEHRLGRDRIRMQTRLAHPVTLWQARLALRRADHVLCLSFEDRDYLTRAFGISPARITRVFPGGDPIYGAVAAARGAGSGDRLLFFGTWLKRKGIDDLVAAFAALAERYPAMTLTVLGAGFPEATVRAAFPAALQSRVRCPKVATESDIAEVLARTDVHVLPSLFEGTPLTIIETMLSGMPTVTTATCGMRDVIVDGDNGLLVPMRSPRELATAVERLVTDPLFRHRLGKAAHADAASKYTWECVAPAVHQVYGA